jgi:hypothetical protein
MCIVYPIRGKAGNNYFQRLLGVHCTENPIYVFREMKLFRPVPIFYIHVSVIYIFPGSVCLLAAAKRKTDPGNM